MTKTIATNVTTEQMLPSLRAHSWLATYARKPNVPRGELPTVIARLMSNPANIRLDEDVLKTSFVFVFTRRLLQDKYIHFTHTSSEDVFKTSWSRPIYSSWSYDFKTSSRGFQNIFKTSSKQLQDFFKISSRRFQDVYYQVKLFLVTQFQDVFEA